MELLVLGLLLGLLLGFVTRQADGQEQPLPPMTVTCSADQCLIGRNELRMLVQRASLCDWETK